MRFLGPNFSAAWLSFLWTTAIVAGASSDDPTDASNSAAKVRRNVLQSNPDVELPFGDINVVVLTDVHSWIAGHGRHNSNMNADYGDVLSFYERLQQYADSNRKDLFFVMNGDFMDGTGLSTTPPEQLTPLLERMPWDAVNLGNHELYFNDTVDWIVDRFVPHWHGNYLSSNTVMKASGLPVGDRHTYLRGKHSNTTVLTFGFLFNFKGNCASTRVDEVEHVVEQEWFTDVLSKSNFDAILVLAHMHVTDPLVVVIKDAIRDIAGFDMPIQFITGHSHIRGYAVVDELAASFEAGKFLDTVGFCSFPKKSSVTSLGTDTYDETVTLEEKTKLLFPHSFIDTKRSTLAKILHVDALPTTAGMALSDKIHQTQQQMGLMETLGCASHTFKLDSGVDEPFSLWGLYMHEIIPAILTNHDQTKLFVQSPGALRYDLMQGTVLLDDVISVCPFNDTIYQIASNISGQTILDVLNITNIADINQPDAGKLLPKWAVSVEGGFLGENKYDLLGVHFDAMRLHKLLQNVTGLPVPLPKPLMWNDTKDFIKTTNLWKSYVKQFWPCRQPSPAASSQTSAPMPNDETILQEERPLATALFVGVVLIGVCLYRKQKPDARSGYSSIAEATTPMKRYYNF